MTDPLIDALNASYAAADQSPNGVRYGVIVSATVPVTVRVGAGVTATECRLLASYTPVVGDYVAVWVSGADRVILGKATGTPSAPVVIPTADGVWTHNPNALTFTAGANTYTFQAIPKNRYMRMANGTVTWQVMCLLSGTYAGTLALDLSSAPYPIRNSDLTSEGGDGGIFGPNFLWYLPLGSGFIRNSITNNWYPMTVMHDAGNAIYFVSSQSTGTSHFFDDSVYGNVGSGDTVAFTVIYEDAAGRADPPP